MSKTPFAPLVAAPFLTLGIALISSPAMAEDGEIKISTDFVAADSAVYQAENNLLSQSRPGLNTANNFAQTSISNIPSVAGKPAYIGHMEMNKFSLNNPSAISLPNIQDTAPASGNSANIIKASTNADAANAEDPTYRLDESLSDQDLKYNAGSSYELSNEVELEGVVRYKRITNIDYERHFLAANNDGLPADINGRYETKSRLVGVRFDF